jgi:hypothetical protein
MRFKMIACMLAVALLSAVAYSGEDDNEKKREKSRKMAAQTLQDLYKAQPTAQAAKGVKSAQLNLTLRSDERDC